MRLASFLALALVCHYRVGCDGAGDTGPGNCVAEAQADAGADDAGTGDAGDADAGATDAGATDAGATDAGATDAGATDAGATDAGATDAGATDAGATDAGATDAGAADAGRADAGSTLLVSATPISDATGFTYVELDVDWSRSLAYLGSRRTGVCVDVVDFSNPPAPVLVHTLGTAGLYGCLGVRLFDGDTKLAVSANGTSNVEVWDLTANPRDFAGWTLLADAPLGNQGKRFAAIDLVSTGRWALTVTTRLSVRTLDFTLDGGLSQAAINIPPAGEFNDSTVLGNWVLLQSYLGAAEPILQLDRANMLSQAVSVPTSYWAWTASTNAARTTAFLGGAPGFAVLSLDSGGSTLVRREFSTAGVNTNSYRGSTIVASGADELAYGVYSDCQVDVFRVTDPLAPVLVQSGRMPIGTFLSECYAVRVNPATDTGLIVSNRGTFIVFRPSLLPTATFQYPPVP